jgi:hypothetical protein
VPGALERPVVEQVALRHRKMLVGTDIAQSGYFAAVPDEADRITSRPHALQNGPFSKLPERGNCFKGRFFICFNVWNTARCAHF